MERIKFLYVEIKVYPASVEQEQYTGIYGFAYDWDTLLISKEPVLSTFENIFDLQGCHNDIQATVSKWIREEILNIGKEQIYSCCPESSDECIEMGKEE